MKQLKKKGQVEEFFDDLIAFGLIAVLFLLFALYIRGLNTNLEDGFEDAKNLLTCNEDFLLFLQEYVIIDDEKMTRYELAMRMTEKYYRDWFLLEANNYFSSIEGDYFIAAYPYTPNQDIQLDDFFYEYIGMQQGTEETCTAEIYLPLLEEYKLGIYKRNFVKIQLKSWS